MRFRGFNYSQPGFFFVTICAGDKQCIFGAVFGTDIVQSELGRIVEEQWHDLPESFPDLRLDEFIVMPNHVHGILELSGDGVSLGTVVGRFKSAVTLRSRRSELRNKNIWQRGYHDRIVRNESELNVYQQYIRDNPMRWIAKLD
jgi:REP element-mobilizing transposase RayT